MAGELGAAAGAVAVDLNGAQADLAVGCGYKYLNGGPGAPAFLFVAERRLGAIRSPLWGWMGHAEPFAFEDGYRPASDIRAMITGTPPILGLAALEAGVDLQLQADPAAVEAKGLALCDLFIREAEARAVDPDLTLTGPRDLGQRFERRRVLPFVLEEPCVLDPDRHMGAELTEDRLVIRRELPRRVAEQVERADDAPLAAERHDELCARARHGFDVPRIDADVVDEDRVPFGSRGADESMADRDPERSGDWFRIADRVRDRQLAALLVEQVQAERGEMREPGDELRDLRQQLFEIEHGGDFTPEREERRQLFRGIQRFTL